MTKLDLLNEAENHLRRLVPRLMVLGIPVNAEVFEELELALVRLRAKLVSVGCGITVAPQGSYPVLTSQEMKEIEAIRAQRIFVPVDALPQPEGVPPAFELNSLPLPIVYTDFDASGCQVNEPKAETWRDRPKML